MSAVVGFPWADSAPKQPALMRFHHPKDVLHDCALSSEEKRAILSAWASDAWVVPSTPALRWPPELPRPVAVDAILDALTRLDEPPDPHPGGMGARPAGRSNVPWPSRRHLGRQTRRYLERHIFKPPDEIAAEARGS